jgi:hypothetical protein
LRFGSGVVREPGDDFLDAIPDFGKSQSVSSCEARTLSSKTEKVVGAGGFEADSEPNQVADEQQLGSIGNSGRADASDDSDPKRPIAGGGSDDIVLTPELVGVVESALARALEAAAAAGKWEVVGQLAAELAARRQGRDGGSGQVVPLRPEKPGKANGAA